MDKTQYLRAVSEVCEVLKKFSLETAVSGEVVQIRKDLEEYACRVLVIGSFNAGKSAFLNELLERELLEEAQIPETAIATEICFSEEEYIEAVSEDGKRQRFRITEGKKFSPKDWRHLVYHVNCPYLQKHSDLVLVDMPGLDSDYEWHNRAITQYINRGNAYILLVSCEDGTLRASVRDFLQEIRHYPQDIYCFISKTDLKLDSELDGVIRNVERNVQSICGSNTPIECISSRTDSEFREKTETALRYFDSQRLFKAKFAPVFNQLITTASVALYNAANAMTLNTDELNQRISACQENREELVKQLESEKQKMVNKNRREVTPATIRDIEMALNSQVRRFVTALAVSPEAFSSAVNSVLRSALYNANTRVQGSFSNLVSEMDLSFLHDDISEFETSIKASLEKLIAYNQTTQNQEKLLQDGKRVYEVVTGILAIATDFINPLLEIAIVMLPSIISMFSDCRKQEQEAELERKIRNAIIPQIVEQLTPEVEEALQETLESMLLELESQVSQLIQAEEVALEQAQDEKRQYEKDFEAFQQGIYNAMEKLEEMRAKMEENDE